MTPDLSADRLTVDVHEACYISGLGRNSILIAIERGQLKSVKLFGRRLVVLQSLRQMIADAAEIPYEDTKRGAPNPPRKRGRPAKAEPLIEGAP